MSELVEHTAAESPRPRPEDYAGLANGLLILSIPIVFFVIWLVMPSPSNTAIGRDPLVSGLQRAVRPILVLAYALMMLLPVALIVGWRTWEHAKRVRAGQSQDWQGILEAGGTGVGLAWLVLLRPTLRNPTQAPPYLIAYGLIGLAVGLAVGIVLWLVARLTLWIAVRHRESRQVAART